MTEEKIIQNIVSLVPKTMQGQARTPLGDQVAHAVEQAMQEERQRCLGQVRGLIKKAEEIRGQAQREGNQLLELQANSVLGALVEVTRAINSDACPACAGTKLTRSTIAAAMGVAATVPCPECQGPRLHLVR